MALSTPVSWLCEVCFDNFTDSPKFSLVKFVQFVQFLTNFFSRLRHARFFFPILGDLLVEGKTANLVKLHLWLRESGTRE